jgi:hypothetical protein
MRSFKSSTTTSRCCYADEWRVLMPVGAAIGTAAASLGGSFLQSNAAQNASQQQAQYAQQALATQQAMFSQGLSAQQGLFGQGQAGQQNYFNTGLGQAQNYFGTAQNALAPWQSAGQSVIPTLQALLNPGTASKTLESLPGFKFQSDWGNMQATNALSAQGLGGSTGPLAKAISDYNQGLASTSYGSIVDKLMGFAGLGSNAAGALASSATNTGNSIFGNATSAGNALLGGANTAGGNILNAATGAGNAMAGTTQNIGNAQAAGTLGSANALAGGLTSGFSGGANAYMNMMLYNKFLGSQNSPPANNQPQFYQSTNSTSGDWG